MIDFKYFQDIVFALEKALYYERGRGAYFRSTMVGADFIDRKIVKGDTIEEIIENCSKIMYEEKMVKNISFKKDETGVLFIFEIENCIHLPIENILKDNGVPPYICPPINMILYKLNKMKGLPCEIADINVYEKDKRCRIRVIGGRL
jgi:hypothetical protein